MEEPGCFDSVEYISLEQWDDIQEGKINSSILGCDPEDRYPHPPCDKVYILPSDDSKQA